MSVANAISCCHTAKVIPHSFSFFMSIKYLKQIKTIAKYIHQRRLVEAEKKLIVLLQIILNKFPFKPTSDAVVEYAVVQCLYQDFDEKFFPSISDDVALPLFDSIHFPLGDLSWVDRKNKNYFLLACCRNPQLMDDILRQMLNFLLPIEPWYFSQETLLQAINDYSLHGWSSRLLNGVPRFNKLR